MRRVIVTLLICVFALGMNAQDMTSVFTAMPDQYIPQLEHAWRKDLVDLYTSGKESRLKNTEWLFYLAKANERLPFATDYGA